MARFSLSSLRARLLLLVLVAALPAFGLIFYTAREQERVARAQAYEEGLRLARRAAIEQRQLIDGARQLLVALAHVPSVFGGEGSSCNALFAALLKEYPFYGGLVAATPDGDVFCSAPPITQSVNFTDRDWYRQLIRTREFTVGGYQRGRISHKTVRVLAYPIQHAQGELQGIVIASLDLDWLNDMLKGANLPPGSSLTIIDRDGTVLARHPHPERWVGVPAQENPLVRTVLDRRGEAVLRAPGLDGVERLYAFTPMGSAGVPGVYGAYVGVGIPAAAETEEAARTLARNLTGLGLIVAAVIALGWLGSGVLILRPVDILLAATERIRAGDFSVRTGLARGSSELGQLSRTFDDMAATLERNRDEQARAEAALRASEERLRQMVDGVRDYAIFMLDPAGRVVSWNDGAQRIKGYGAGEIIGEHFSRFYPEEDRAAGKCERMLTAAAAGRCEDEGWRVRKDGSRFWASAVLTAIRDRHGELIGFSRITRDLTERRQAELRLQEQVGCLILLNQITRAIIERQDIESIIRVAIRHLEDHLHVDCGWACLCDPRDNTVRVLATNGRSQEVAERMGLGRGVILPVGDLGLVECMQGGTVYVADTARERALLFQKYAQAGLRSLAAAPLFAEKRVAGVLVVARHEASAFSSVDCEFLRMLGEQLGLVIHQAQLHMDLQRAYADLRESQQAVLRQERLKALGQMASGIAHDINNALAPAALYLEALGEAEPTLSARGRERLATVQRALDDVAHTVERLREFYRPEEAPAALGPVDLPALVRQVLELTRPRWQDQPQARGVVIAVQTDLVPALPAVRGIAHELRDALTNLIFNAVDAMPHGGTLTLAARLVPTGTGEPGNRRAVGSDSPTPRFSDSLTLRRPDAPSPAEGEFVELCVSDTGLGMDEATRARCLEPFFTTKGERGTGLGLAMVYGIVQRHEGELDIASAPGEGTTVCLRLPPAPAAAAGEHLRAGARPARALRLLVVDDDPLIRQSLQETLAADGHAVTVAPGGREGIACFQAAQAQRAPFDVVLTDLGMPHVDGRAVAQAVKATAPATPVLLLTGWGAGLTANGEIPPHVDRILSKPPKLQALRSALAGVTT